MKLDYLATGATECPLLRLYDFTTAEATELRAAVLTLANGTATTIAVHQLPFVQAVEGCQLELAVKKWEEGVVPGGGPLAFRFGLQQERWNDIARLIEPFTRLATGFQWLQASVDECSLLLTANGKW